MTTSTSEIYPRRTRILHWLVAILVFAALVIGFTMVHTVADYTVLVAVHKTLGVVILAVVVLRAVNRFTHRVPPLPRTVGRAERVLVVGSEFAMYGLLLAQPLVGWAMVSASGTPVVVFGGIELPAIAPTDAGAYAILRNTHSVLALALAVTIAAHISAVLLHTITLRDGMIRRITLRPKNART
ncbi:cytochrome b [Mycobacterium sp.]|jgi:cytochrome b561|uniref:cytochrome b n=1 Tax=Mycobacterium sp. TaxID=1785 RepID=UPI002D36C0DF|nr:cytochrome b [Mycobacterium sp.]HZA09036.1 cytochrome b [Mycobacterium sp.]